jgi:hypothetical protein
MRKVAGAVSAVAFMAAAAAIWSGLATSAAGRARSDIGTPPRLVTSNTGDTPLPADFIRQPAAAERGTTVSLRAEMIGTGDCSWRQWPFMGSDCFGSTALSSLETNAMSTPETRAETPAEPVRAPAPAPIAAAAPVAPQPVAAAPAAAPAPAASTPVVQKVAAVVPVPVRQAAPAPVAPAVIAPAPVTRAPASCPQTLAAASARMERAIAAVKGGRTNESAETCAAYRRNFFDVVQAREVTALCKTGADRAQDLGRIDVALENMNGTIAKSCGG